MNENMKDSFNQQKEIDLKFFALEKAITINSSNLDINVILNHSDMIYGWLNSDTLNDNITNNYMNEITVSSEPKFELSTLAENHRLILKTPIRFHLIEILKELKYGRPANNQKMIDKWIAELELNPENGEPF
jgi:hypothetical protein